MSDARPFCKRGTTPRQYDATALAVDLQSLEQRARLLGLYVTARGINQAINGIGWEASGNLGRATKAINGTDRP